MKKNLSVSCLCVLFVLMISFSGSKLSGQSMYLGIQGGLAIPNLRDNSNGNPLSEGYSSRTAPVFGVFGGERILPMLDLLVELLYAGEGGKKNGTQAIQQLPEGTPLMPGEQDYLYANVNSVSVLNYLELPILLKFNINLHVLHLFIDAGPYFGYLSGATQKLSGSNTTYVEIGNEYQPTPNPLPLGNTTITSDINKFNWGFTGGIGISKSFGPGKLILDGRVEYGLSNIQKYPADGSNNTGAVFITLGYSIKI